MKKKIALAVATVMAMSTLALGVSADEYTEVSLLIAGQEVVTDQPAVIVDSRTMVPVRVIAESLGCEVDWDAETKTVTFTQDGVVATMVVGEAAISVVSGDIETDIEIDTPAIIINGRTMVPVRFISELFGCEVDWDAETKTVSITVADEVESDAAVAVDEETTEEAEDEDTEAETDEEEADEDAEEETEADEDAESDDEDADEETTVEEETEETTEDTEEETEAATTDSVFDLE